MTKTPTATNDTDATQTFLESLPEPIRSAWRFGDWDIFSGQVFELIEGLHVIDGAEVCRMLKAADSAHRHIPVIAFTATVNKIKETYGILGADDYVIKPFDIGELLEKIARLMAGRGGEQSGQP